MFKRIAFLFWLALFGVSCAAPIAPRTPVPLPPEPTTSVGLATPAATSASLPSPQPTLDEYVLAIYHKSGGFAGIDETLVIGQGGLLTLTRRGEQPKTLKLDEPMMLPVRSVFEQNDMGTFDARYTVPGADLFTYTITARGKDGQVKTVTVTDGANPPPAIKVIISMLEQLRALVK